MENVDCIRSVDLLLKLNDAHPGLEWAQDRETGGCLTSLLCFHHLHFVPDYSTETGTSPIKERDQVWQLPLNSVSVMEAFYNAYFNFFFPREPPDSWLVCV